MYSNFAFLSARGLRSPRFKSQQQHSTPHRTFRNFLSQKRPFCVQCHPSTDKSLPNQPALSCSIHGRALTSTSANRLRPPPFKSQQHPLAPYHPFHNFSLQNDPVKHSSTPSTDKKSLNQPILVLSSQPSADQHERKHRLITTIQGISAA